MKDNIVRERDREMIKKTYSLEVEANSRNMVGVVCLVD